MGTLIIGAGLCGLSAAFHLEQRGEPYLVLEKESEVGGLVRTETYDGFSFDHSIHILYTSDPYVASLIQDDLLAGNLGRQTRRSFCYSHGVYTEYPYQINNYGLPGAVIIDNILGLIESQSGPPPAEAAHFEEWIYRTFGRGIADNFMIPYNRRQWAWDLRQMNFDWIAERVPVPDLEEVIRGALEPPTERFGPNSEFWYPLEGGIEMLAVAFAERLPKESVLLGWTVTSIDIDTRQVTLEDGSALSYDRVISSLPIPSLVEITSGADPEVKARAASLASNVVHTVDLGFEGLLATEREMHWVYFPGGESDPPVFHRLSFPGAFAAWMVPDGCFSIQAEISESPHKPQDRSALVEQTLQGLVAVGLVDEDAIRPVASGGSLRVAEVVTLDPAYVIYDLHHAENTRFLRNWYGQRDIETRGRFGEWEYMNMDHAILSGRAATGGSGAKGSAPARRST